MSELDLPSLAAASKIESHLTPIKEIDAALKACTFGRFHIRLLVTAFVGMVAGILISSSTGYLLPEAECDLEMNLVQKGLLNAMPYFGTLVSSVLAGFLVDAFGRKVFIVWGYLGMFVCILVAASSQSYAVIVTAKFFEGIVFAACFSAVITITSEFCYNGIRDRIMLTQSSFSSISQIVVALMTWRILINDWKVSFFGGKFVLNTWNFYLYAMSLWYLAASIMYAAFVPESPKYLVTQKKYDEARAILIKIYVQNTGKPADTYPFANIWKDQIKHAIDETAENEVKNTFKHHLVVGLHNIKPMFEKPLAGYLGLICLSNFIIMSMYNVLRLWFPQLSAIVENSQANGADFCVTVDAYTANLRATKNITDMEVCVPIKSGDETYINTVIIGCICFLPYIVTGFLVNKVGKKNLLTVSSLICVGSALGIRWASNKVAVTAFFSIAVAISQLCLSLNQALTVSVFGTSTRTFAVSLMMFCGRIGTLTGNITFPVLLDMACVIPFFAMACSMSCVTVLTFFLPAKK